MGSDAANCFTRGSTAKTQPEQFTVDLKEKTMAKCTKLIKTYNYKMCYREKCRTNSQYLRKENLQEKTSSQCLVCEPLSLFG